MSEHIKAEQSMALVALAADDPERLQAEQHAQGCSACRSTLDEAALMLSWVDAYAPMPVVNPALKARIQNAVLSTQVQATRFDSAKGSRIVSKWLLALGVLSSALLAWLSSEPGALAPAQGLHCVMFETMTAVAPFAVAAYLGMRGKIALQPLNLATVSMAGALAGQVILQSRCPDHATPHLFAFHVAGVVLAAALGYTATVGLRGLQKA